MAIALKIDFKKFLIHYENPKHLGKSSHPSSYRYTNDESYLENVMSFKLYYSLWAQDGIVFTTQNNTRKKTTHFLR